MFLSKQTHITAVPVSALGNLLDAQLCIHVDMSTWTSVTRVAVWRVEIPKALPPPQGPGPQQPPHLPPVDSTHPILISHTHQNVSS